MNSQLVKKKNSHQNYNYEEMFGFFEFHNKNNLKIEMIDHI